MLRPIALTAAQYKLATKPGLGYEQQLFVSPQGYTNPGVLLVAGANSGVYTPNTSDNATLLGTPQELLAVLDNDVNETQNIVLTVNGTDQNNAPLTGTATFAPPAYAQDQNNIFGKGRAVEIVPTVDGKLFKTILSVSISCSAASQYLPIKILGVPSIASFVQIGTKITLNTDPKVPMPVAVGDGRDKGRYIKAGDIDVGAGDISTKVPTFADGLARYNGIAVTGLIKEIKENKLGTQNIFLCGLIMTAKNKVGEDATPNTLDATMMYEQYGYVLAGGAGQ